MLKVRKSEASLSQQERLQFIDAMKRMKANGRYDYYVQIHYDAMNMSNMPNMMDHSMMAHGGPLFLPWHRHYIAMIERELGVPIPYWDWSVNSPNMWASDFMGGDGDQQGIVTSGAFSIRSGWSCRVGVPDTQPGPELRRFLRGRQTPDNQDDRLPTSQQINQVLSIQNYGEFCQRLEALHNIAHAWVGGSMGTSASPNDPVFFLNHAFVDYMWARWQSMHPNIPHFAPVNMLNNQMDYGGKIPTVPIAQTLDIRSLGYTYEGLTPVQPQVPNVVINPPNQHPSMPPQHTMPGMPGMPGMQHGTSPHTPTSPNPPISTFPGTNYSGTKPLKPVDQCANIYKLPPYKYNDRHSNMVEHKPCAVLGTSVCQCKQRKAVLEDKMKKRGIYNAPPPNVYIPDKPPPPKQTAPPPQQHYPQPSPPQPHYAPPQQHYPQPTPPMYGNTSHPSYQPQKNSMKPPKTIDQCADIYNLPPYKYNARHQELIEHKQCPLLGGPVCQCKQREAILKEKMNKRGMYHVPPPKVNAPNTNTNNQLYIAPHQPQQQYHSPPFNPQYGYGSTNA